MIGVLGILKAGGAYVALETNTPSKRIEAILEDARPAVILVNSNKRSSDQFELLRDKYSDRKHSDCCLFGSNMLINQQ